MQIKEIKPMNVLFFSEKTTIHEMMKFVRVKANELYRNAIENNLEITGPVYWIYYGMNGQPNTRFILEICIPVHPSGVYSGPFALKKLPVFRCASDSHYGSWQEMAQVYQVLIGDIFQGNHTMIGVTREVYLNMDFVSPENNMTEIQIGIN
jgi:effector-binding domain-containing protein